MNEDTTSNFPLFFIFFLLFHFTRSDHVDCKLKCSGLSENAPYSELYILGPWYSNEHPTYKLGKFPQLRGGADEPYAADTAMMMPSSASFIEKIDSRPNAQFGNNEATGSVPTTAGPPGKQSYPELPSGSKDAVSMELDTANHLPASTQAPSSRSPSSEPNRDSNTQLTKTTTTS